MALFVIHGFDKADAAPGRLANYPAHRAYLADAKKWGIKLVISGPLTRDDGITPIGSLIIFEAIDRQAADAFHQADPFYTAGVWEKTTVTCFDKKQG